MIIKKMAILIVVLLVLTVSTLASGEVVTIDFEELPDRLIVADHYPGIYFANTIESTHYILDSPMQIEGDVGIRSNEGPGLIRHTIVFDIPVKNVSIWVATSRFVQFYSYDVTGTNLTFDSIGPTLWDYPDGYQLFATADGISYIQIVAEDGFWVADLLSYDAPPGMIDGVVVDSTTKELISDAFVVIKRGDFVKMLVTDGDGYYKLEHLDSGFYLVICFKRHYDTNYSITNVVVGTISNVSFDMQK